MDCDKMVRGDELHHRGFVADPAVVITYMYVPISKQDIPKGLAHVFLEDPERQKEACSTART